MAAIDQEEILAVKEQLLIILEDLEQRDLKKFKWYLANDVPKGKLDKVSRLEVVDILVEKYEQIGSLDQTLKILGKIDQNNLAKKLAEYKAVFEALPESVKLEIADKKIPKCQKELKQFLIKTNQNVDKGETKRETSTLNQIFAEIHLTEGEDDPGKHEMCSIEMSSVRPSKEIAIASIFQPKPETGHPPRVVVSKGVAGIGKTIAAQKFTLDWAEEKNNQDIQFVFPFLFRELNTIDKKEKCSFNELINKFYPHMKQYEIDYSKFKVLFILEGLDEYKCSSLDFNTVCRDVNEANRVDVLLTNLIKGELLPGALVWITSRPTAAKQIPGMYVDLVTEVPGFNDSQKEEFFKNNISDKSLSERVIRHIKSTSHLHAMCQIPVFCFMAALVLGRMLTDSQSEEIPKTLTEMYIYYFIEEFKRNVQKSTGRNFIDLKDDDDYEVVMSLGKLAYNKLQKNDLVFREKDLQDCGINKSKALTTCPHIFKEEQNDYMFEHLSIQEFLAAMYAFLSFYNGKEDVVNQTCKAKAKALINKNSSGFLKRSVDTVLEKKSGNLDHFLRFLLGLTLESNHKRLGGLLRKTKYSPCSNEEIVEHIKKKIQKNGSPERCVNLFYCLVELQDQSLVKDIKGYIGSNGVSKQPGKVLTPEQLSAIAFVVRTSDDLHLGQFQLRDYLQSSGPRLNLRPSTSKSEDSLLRLLPVVEVSQIAKMDSCGLTWRSCQGLASILSSSSLRELDLCNNINLQDSGVKMLCLGLEKPDCQLKILRLAGCGLRDKGFKYLASALEQNPTHLKELDLGQNDPGVAGVEMIAKTLKLHKCKLETLRMYRCGINEGGFASLASALKENPSHLRELDLNRNSPGDEGLKSLAGALEMPECKLEKLYVSHEKLIEFDIGLDDMERSIITGRSCAALASALKSNHSHLQVLDLGGSDLQKFPEAKLLLALKDDPHNRLVELNLEKKEIERENLDIF